MAKENNRFSYFSLGKRKAGAVPTETEGTKQGSNELTLVLVEVCGLESGGHRDGIRGESEAHGVKGVERAKGLMEAV